MLEMRPNCECCDVDLSPGAAAFICSFECTFCGECALELNGECPNCSGELLERPTRAPHLLAQSPASTKRVRRSVPCF